MQRTTLNAVLDAVAAVLFLGMVMTGFVIQFALPPGSGRVWRLWGLARHDWSRSHAIISAGLLLTIVGHVVLHWKWIAQMASRKLGRHTLSGGKLAVLTVAILLVSCGGFATSAFLMRQPATQEDLAECAPRPGAAVAPVEQIGGDVLYGRDVEPLLRERCVGCHNAARAAGGARLDGYDETIAQIVIGSPEKSRLIRILQRRPDPSHEVDSARLELLQRWIREGAKR